MAEYIDREALLKCQFEFYSHGTHCYEKAVYADVIKTFPAADVVEVVHGEWEIVKLPPDPGYKAKECSVCKCNFWDLEEWDYCPNCGSRMDGGDGDG